MCTQYIATDIIVVRFSIFPDLPDPAYCPNNCGRCYRGPGRKGTLKRHLKHECGVPRKFQCSYCLKRFALKENLKTHYARVHKLVFNRWKSCSLFVCLFLFARKSFPADTFKKCYRTRARTGQHNNGGGGETQILGQFPFTVSRLLPFMYKHIHLLSPPTPIRAMVRVLDA